MDTKNELIAQWPLHKQRIEGYVFSLVKDKDETNDIVQEVFVKAFIKIGSLKNPDKLLQWLFSIARNETNRYFNFKKKYQPATEENETTDEPVATTNGLESCIGHFIGELPEKYSTAVQLAELENITQYELAKRLTISYSGAKSRVQRGKAKLKEMLTQCCQIEHDIYGNIIDYTPKQGGYCAQRCS
jgi:RNA polymerase sigma-70 factor (ECF subfamily)